MPRAAVQWLVRKGMKAASAWVTGGFSHAVLPGMLAQNWQRPDYPSSR